jgi:hypothetical protein
VKRSYQAQNSRCCYCRYSHCSSEKDYVRLLLEVVLVVDDDSLFDDYMFAAGGGLMIGNLFSTDVVDYWTDPDDVVVVDEIVVEVFVVSLTLRFPNLNI